MYLVNKTPVTILSNGGVLDRGAVLVQVYPTGENDTTSFWIPPTKIREKITLKPDIKKCEL